VTTKEPPSGAWRNPSNGNTRAVLEWLARIVIGLLCWIALDTLNTTRAEAREQRKELAEIAIRIVKLETLRPEDSRRLQQIETTVGRIAARLGVEP